MSKALSLLLAAAAVSLPLAACAQQPNPAPASTASANPASDRQYCDRLSELYIRYVGRSEGGPTAPVRPDVNGGVALAKCKEGDTAVAIPILERKLVNAGFTLPPRG